MQSFFSVLTWASMGLLVPCIALLLYFLIRALLLIGQEWQQRRIASILFKEIDTIEDELLTSNFAEFRKKLIEMSDSKSFPLTKYLARIVNINVNKSMREKQLGDFALYGESELATPRMLIRLGPSLGLVGTLIPMGPALAGLANGDLVSLSQNMQVAFSTTVLGVLVGGIGFVLYQSRKHRFAQAMHKLDFLFQYVQEVETSATN